MTNGDVQDVNSQLSSLTIDSEEDEYDDGSIDDAISAYEGPAASLPSQTPPPYVASTGRTGVYMVTNGRRTGIFSTWEETHAATSGFSHCRYARYNSQQEAETAWQLALESGCVGPPDLGTAALATESHPISSDSVRISTEAETFWVVLRGRRPGVYIGRENARRGVGNAAGGVIEYAASLDTANHTFWFINESYCEPQKVSHVTELYNMPSQKASSSSRYVKQISGHHRSQKASRMHLCSKLLGLKQITKAKLAAAEQMQQKQLYTILNDYEDISPTHSEPDRSTFDGVLAGDERMDISHAGGEFHDVEQSVDVNASTHSGIPHLKHTRDFRTRRDRIAKRIKAFDDQMDEIVKAYMAWSFNTDGKEADNEDASETEAYRIRVVDIYDVQRKDLAIRSSDKTIASCLLRHGVLPCSPLKPTVAITIRAVEFYRLLHLRCPHVSIQSYVKTLCDMHMVPFERWLSRQFSISYDLYLDIQQRVDLLVQAALEREAPDWRLRNACPACTYKLKGEHPLKYDMLFTMDGNNSLKRIIRRGPLGDGTEELGPAIDHLDPRLVTSDYYIPKEDVDKWNTIMVPDQDVSEGNPCVDRWKNMSSDVTKRMWGIFDETGIFLSLCRHGFTLVITDMIQSGELAKYPLAVVEKLLSVFGPNLGGGYDIGCQFQTTLENSKLGMCAKQMNYSSLVGAFHGHAHNRICQLSNLATYVKGLGLEDLEGCERAFSQSNALAGAHRYSSRFHRHQDIIMYFRHKDRSDVYQALSTFLVNNYNQALDILNNAPVTLARAKQELGIEDNSVFEEWLLQEREYLRGLKKEPLNETLEMEYCQRLVALQASESALSAAQKAWIDTTPEMVSAGSRDKTLSLETRRRHTLETRDRTLLVVQELEEKMGITHRWKIGSSEWRAAAKLVVNRKYQLALDNLESLVVARIFELSKMNMSGTGYKLRQHIAKALQTRSKAVHTALDRYNAIATQLSPPRPILQWTDVVNYALLADFDLLRDTRQDVRLQPWARPTGRMAMDLYFKIQRAQEEIGRLNIEIRRVITYIHDEDQYLRKKEAEYQELQPYLSHQISLYRKQWSRFNASHIRRFQGLGKSNGFSGTILPGQNISTALMDIGEKGMGDTENMQPGEEMEEEEEEEMEEEEAEEEEAVATGRELESIAHLSLDA